MTVVFKISYAYMHFLNAFMCITYMQNHGRPEDVGSPGTRTAGSYETLDMGAANKT